MSITLPQNYRPTEREAFMNPMQLEYFRQKLLGWKAELLRESNETLSGRRWTTLTQFALEFCEGRTENVAPVAGAIAATVPWKT